METYIALLRGINVSGQKKINMADLRTLLEKTGFGQVRTYIQSGNVIFDHALADEKELAEKIAAAIFTKYGFEVPVIVLDAAYIRSVFEKNPFIASGHSEIQWLHVTLLAEAPDPEAVSTLKAIAYPPDEWIIQGKAIYLFCPNGYGRTKLTNTFFERKLKVSATTRNWKTMIQLLEISEKKT